MWTILIIAALPVCFILQWVRLGFRIFHTLRAHQADLKRRGENLQTRGDRSPNTSSSTLFSHTLVAQDEFDCGLRELLQQVQRPELGVFELAPPVTHRISRESSSMLFGLPPVLMQIAHPYVAYAIKQHSRAYAGGRHLHDRFLKTMAYGFGISYGSVNEVAHGSKTVRRLHNRVVGCIEQDCGAFAAGHTYHANDLGALQWVQATLIVYGVLAHEVLVEHLSPADKEQHYQYVRHIAPVWGIRSDRMPPTWETFLDDYARMVYSRVLSPSPPAAVMFNWLVPQNAWSRVSLAVLLPEPMCAVYSLSRRCSAMEWGCVCGVYALIRMLYRWLPLRLRQLTPYSDWLRRRARSEKLGWLERVSAAVGARLLQRADTVRG